MDISNLKPQEREIEIVNPATEEEIGITVTILSVHDPEMEKIKRRISDHNMILEKKGKTLKAAEIDENVVNILSGAIKNWVWRGDANYNGEVPEFNIKNVKEILKEFYWFKDQILKEVNDEKAFFTASK